MDAELWKRIERLFIAAAQLAPEERGGLLDRECGEDPGLRDEVESLLQNDVDTAASLTGAVHGAAEQATSVLDARHLDRRIGAYRVVRELGRGGMGIVFLARRADDAYSKEVAIKLLRFGLGNESLLRRFRNERQILANLEHPNIARLLDGGTTDAGEPYVVMEYVDGRPIDAHCDAGKLATGERLRLFLDVCAALQYAHDLSVVHRDIKPGNILITPDGTPKLLDFGIAKLLDPALPGADVETGTATRLMTPEYASPEQIRGEAVTPATDVYALGLLLYELLTGHHPYRSAATHPGELARRICEEDPRKPSTEAVSSVRGIASSRLRRLLAGDLDTIVLTALRKDPANRYGSVQELAQDVRRHLDGEPIRARPASLGYRAGKFVRRKPVHAALLLVLALGIPTVGVLGGRAVQQQRVERVERIEALLTEARWLEERERYGKVLDRVEAILELDAHHALALRHRAWARFQLSTETSDPEETAELQRLALEDVAAAIRAEPGASWPHALHAIILRRLGRGEEAAEAEERAKRYPQRTDEELDFAARLALKDRDPARAVEIYSELVLRHPDRSPAMISLAYAYEDLGDFDAAVREYRVASGIDPDQDLIYIDLARLAIRRGDLDRAGRYLEQALELDPGNAVAHENRGLLEWRRGMQAAGDGNVSAADAAFLRSEAAYREALALDPDLYWSEISLGTTLISRNGLSGTPDPELTRQALNHYDGALERWTGPPESGQQREAYSIAVASRCDALIQLGRLDEALTTCTRVTTEFPDDAIGFYNLAGVHAQLGDADAALAALRRDFELGDHDWQYLLDDAWFESMRDDPRFVGLIERMKESGGR